MNYSSEIRGLMAEGRKLHVAVEARRKQHGRDREYSLLRIERDQIAAHEDELRRQAAKEFAALNGWRWVERQFFARTLARGGTHDGRWTYDELTDGWLHHCLFDHPLFFREIARPHCRRWRCHRGRDRETRREGRERLTAITRAADRLTLVQGAEYEDEDD